MRTISRILRSLEELEYEPCFACKIDGGICTGLPCASTKAALMMLPGVATTSDEGDSPCIEETPDWAEGVRVWRGDFGGGGGGLSTGFLTCIVKDGFALCGPCLGAGLSDNLLTGIDKPRPLGAAKGEDSDCLLSHAGFAAGSVWLSRM